MENPALFFAPFAIVAAAVGGWAVQQRIARARATVDFMSRNESGNPNWQKELRRFAEITNHEKHPRPLIALVDPQTQAEYQDRLLVSSVLNRFELVAVAIKSEAFSEEIYKRWGGSFYVDAWEKAEPYISARRAAKKQPTAYEYFEKLAKKWAGQK